MEPKVQRLARAAGFCSGISWSRGETILADLMTNHAAIPSRSHCQAIISCLPVACIDCKLVFESVVVERTIAFFM